MKNKRKLAFRTTLSILEKGKTILYEYIEGDISYFKAKINGGEIKEVGEFPTNDEKFTDYRNNIIKNIREREDDLYESNF